MKNMKDDGIKKGMNFSFHESVWAYSPPHSELNGNLRVFWTEYRIVLAYDQRIKTAERRLEKFVAIKNVCQGWM